MVKAQHGTRQGLIEASLSKASLLLTEIGSVRQQQYIITNLGDAIAVMSKPQQVHWFRKNTVHPGEDCMVTRHKPQLAGMLQPHMQQCNSVLLYRSFPLNCLHKSSLNQKHAPDMTVMPCAVAEGGQPLVTSKSAEGGQPLVMSMSADAMYLQQEAVLDIASMCSGPEGCSLSVVLQCIVKGGLQVQSCFCCWWLSVQAACVLH